MSIKLAKAPVAWLNDDMPEISTGISLDSCLKEIKEVGYMGTELGFAFPKDKKQLKALLEKYNLQLVAGWFSGLLLKNGLEVEKDRLNEEIQRRLYVNSNIIVYCDCTGTIQNTHKGISQKPVLSKDEIKSYAKKYTQLYELCISKGITLAYHYHMGTVIQTPQEIDCFLSNCSSSVKITYDTGHIYFADGDPLATLEKYQDRVFHIHLKDVRDKIKNKVIQEDKSFMQAVLDGVFTVPGDGNINFKPIVEKLKNIDYKGYWVIEAEQDPYKANPLEYAKKGYYYIQTIYDNLK